MAFSAVHLCAPPSMWVLLRCFPRRSLELGNKHCLPLFVYTMVSIIALVKGQHGTYDPVGPFSDQRPPPSCWGRPILVTAVRICRVSRLSFKHLSWLNDWRGAAERSSQTHLQAGPLLHPDVPPPPLSRCFLKRFPDVVDTCILWRRCVVIPMGTGRSICSPFLPTALFGLWLTHWSRLV